MNSVVSPNETAQVAELKTAWAQYLAKHPGARIRNAAEALDVSEMDLLATQCGDTVTRLDADWGLFLKHFTSLGEVMALTRNDNAVHEKIGVYDHINIGPGHGLVLNKDIDLRLFMNNWHHGFAVSEETASGMRRSFQFFDVDGVAVHKTYLTDSSHVSNYHALVEQFTSKDQSRKVQTLPLPPAAANPSDSEIDVENFRKHWRALQDTHDFVALLRSFGVSRLQALRLAGDDLAYPVEPAAFRQLLNLAAERETPIMVFVGNRGCIQIHTGPVKKLKAAGPWYNVLDPSFNLHLREDAIASAWVVRKPTRDGVVTSVELFDAQDRNFALLFGERKPGKPELKAWLDIVAELPRAT
ncbi:MAG: hemin-degrading factor [Gammaproteobacteria bacterium]|nr:hemin-degrading factor [Gammaproteobacteria bacterium]